MALSLATVQAQIDAIETAIASGQLQVGYGDKTVRYRDLAEMMQTLAWLQRKEAQLLGATGGSRQIRMVTGDGHGKTSGS